MPPEIFYILKGATVFALGFSIGWNFPKMPVWVAIPIVIMLSYLLSVAFDIFKP